MSKTEPGFFARQLASDRRGFLKQLGLIGGGVVVGGTLQAVLDVAQVGGGRQRISASRVAMGTMVTISLVDRSRGRAEQAIAATFAEMDRLIALLSRHANDSALAVLNREGQLSQAPPELVQLIAASRRFHRISGGAFDISVKPLVDLARQRPDQQAIRQVLPLVDLQAVQVSGRRIRFAKQGMGVTLDGIAKGYIVDRMALTLRGCGASDFLIDAGGDIVCRGHAESGQRWQIAVQDPAKRGQLPARVSIADGAIATSGSYEIFYDDQHLYHHLVDPHSGRCTQHSVSATIRASSVFEADALATAAFVMPIRHALAMVDALPQRAALIIGRDGQLHRSLAWRS